MRNLAADQGALAYDGNPESLFLLHPAAAANDVYCALATVLHRASSLAETLADNEARDQNRPLEGALLCIVGLVNQAEELAKRLYGNGRQNGSSVNPEGQEDSCRTG